MASTTIRVDRDTHAQIVEMSRANGETITETVRQAATALRRLRFGLRVQEQYADLRSNPEAWADYLADAETTDLNDGIN